MRSGPGGKAAQTAARERRAGRDGLGLRRAEAAAVGQNAPPDAPPTRKRSAEEFLGDVGRPKSSSGEPNPIGEVRDLPPDIPPPPGGFVLDKRLPANERHGPWEKYQAKRSLPDDLIPVAPQQTAGSTWGCFHLTAPDGSKYAVAVKSGGNWNAVKIKDLALYNPGLFSAASSANWSGDAAETKLVDLTGGNPLPGTDGYFYARSDDHPDLGFAKLLAILGLAVPIGVFVLGSGFWWVAAGFRS
jgi:hypothetical protein